MLLEEQPLLTKALTSLVGFSAGDYLAQKFVEKGSACVSGVVYERLASSLTPPPRSPSLPSAPPFRYDIKRTLRMGSFGALVHGPTGHWFYGMLDGMIPGATATAVASKVAIDQVGFCVFRCRCRRVCRVPGSKPASRNRLGHRLVESDCSRSIAADSRAESSRNPHPLPHPQHRSCGTRASASCSSRTSGSPRASRPSRS